MSTLQAPCAAHNCYVYQSSKSPNAKPERECECIEVKTVSSTHLRLVVVKKESVFCVRYQLAYVNQ